MLQETPKVVTYTRVSSAKQGRSGLGLEAQAKLISEYVTSRNARVVDSFREVKSGLKERPALKEAIAKAKATRSVLLCAKLDRVGRRASETLKLLDDSKVRVVFADTPNASFLQLGIMAVVAQEEASAISARTKAALSAARDRGVKLGGPNGAAPLLAYVAANGTGKAKEGARRKASEFANDVRAFVEPLIQKGLNDKAIADALNADGIETPREGGRWHITSVRRLRARLAI